MTPKFSIIIPVYNVAPYLRKCLDSMLAQTVADWEAICVDDGSTDGSGAILDEYAAEDGRFKVVHQENKGVAAARQVGLDAAVGDWIASVDPDDWVGELFLANMYRAASMSNADMVWTDYVEQFEDREIIVRQQCPETAFDMAKAIITGRLLGSLCIRLFSRKFLLMNNIRFLKGRVGAFEDFCFICNCLSFNPVLRYAPTVDYHYVHRVGSAVYCTKSKSQDDDIKKTFEYTQRYIEKALDGLGVERELYLRKIKAKLAWFSNPAISDSCFYDTFPEVNTVSWCNAGLAKSILFWLSLKGLRRYVLLLFKIYHLAKRG